MNSSKRNSKHKLDALLAGFFEEKEIDEFKKITGTKKIQGKPQPLSLTSKIQRQTEISDSGENDLSFQVNTLITFAKERLNREKFAELLLSTAKYTMTCGDFDLSLELFERIIKESKGRGSLVNLAAEGNLGLAEVYSKKTKWALGIRYISKSKEIFRKSKNVHGETRCINLLGTIYGETGDFKKARTYFKESLALISWTNDHELIGMIEINLGIISGIFREWRDARLYFNNALKNFEKSSDHKRIALIYNNLGMLDYNSEKLNQALEEFDQSIEECFKLNYLPVLGLSFLGKAITYLKMNNLNLAEAYSDKAMEMCSKVDDKLSIADIYKVKGIIEMEHRNYPRAENLLKTSLRMNIELGNKLNEAETSVELGKLYNKLNDKSKSRQWLQRGIEYYKGMGSKEKIKELEQFLA